VELQLLFHVVLHFFYVTCFQSHFQHHAWSENVHAIHGGDDGGVPNHDDDGGDHIHDDGDDDPSYGEVPDQHYVLLECYVKKWFVN